MFHFEKNQREDLMQKTAWKLVRSAEDRFGGGKGAEKLSWCVDRMQDSFPKQSRTNLEDHVRAACFNFRLEHSNLYK